MGERSLAAELESWALTQTGSVRALALLAAVIASQTESLSVRVAALEAVPEPEPESQEPTVTAAAKTTTKRGTR